MMFCSCCRDVQSAGSTLELPVAEEKNKEPQLDHAEASQGVDATARSDGSVALNPRSPTAHSHGAREQVEETTSDAAVEHRTVVVSSPRDSTRTGAVFKQRKAEPAPVSVPLTLQHGDKARRTSAPIPGSLDAGAYLMKRIHSSGSIMETEDTPVLLQIFTCAETHAHLFEFPPWLWSVASTPISVFFFSPRNAQKTGKYFQGWVSFCKITREYPSKLMLLNNTETSGAPAVRIFLLEIPPDHAGAAFAREVNEPDKLYDLINNIKAVAAVPASSTLLTPDEAIDSKVFIQKGSGIGAALAFGA